MVRITGLIGLILVLSGCQAVMPSIGVDHASNPDAGTGSPHPEREELTQDFGGGGVTVEFKHDVDLHIWPIGWNRRNVALSNGESKLEPGARVILLKKFRNLGWSRR